MARYYTDISRSFLSQTIKDMMKGSWPEGFRVIEQVHGGRQTRSGMVRCLVEDEGAGPEFEGKLVMPVFKCHYVVINKGQCDEYLEPGPVHVQARSLIGDFRL